MASYLIIRHGSNTANQSMCNRSPLTIVEAKTKQEAIEQVRKEGRFTVYNNQHLEAIPESKATMSDWNSAAEDDALYLRRG